MKKLKIGLSAFLLLVPCVLWAQNNSWIDIVRTVYYDEISNFPVDGLSDPYIEPGEEYGYNFFLVDENGDRIPVDVLDISVPEDYITVELEAGRPLAVLLNFSDEYKKENHQVEIHWELPEDDRIESIYIVKKEGGQPRDLGDGEIIFSEGLSENVLDGNILPEKKYFYAIYGIDKEEASKKI